MSAQDYTQLTLYPEASHASRFPSPGSEEARRMTVTSGRKCSELLTSSSPLGLLARMLLGSSQWRSRMVNLSWRAERLTAARERTITRQYCYNAKKCCSTVSSEISKTRDIPSSRLLFRLVPSAPRTDATGYSLLPTPTAQEAISENRLGGCEEIYYDKTGKPRRRLKSGTASMGLGKMARTGMWPTPKASDADMGMTARTSGRPIEKSTHLQTQVYIAERMWPTPRAKESGDYQYSGGNHNKPIPTLAGAVKMFPTPTASSGTGEGHSSSKQGGVNLKTEVGGKLNPLWVEWLMGFPIGWTDLDA